MLRKFGAFTLAFVCGADCSAQEARHAVLDDTLLQVACRSSLELAKIIRRLIGSDHPCQLKVVDGLNYLALEPPEAIDGICHVDTTSPKP